MTQVLLQAVDQHPNAARFSSVTVLLRFHVIPHAQVRLDAHMIRLPKE